MQYGHVYTAFCIIIKLKVMFWKLYTRIDFNVGTFKYCSPKVLPIFLNGIFPFISKSITMYNLTFKIIFCHTNVSK